MGTVRGSSAARRAARAHRLASLTLPNTVLAAIGGYALLIPIPASGYFTDSFRLTVYNTRPYLMVLAAVFLWWRLRAAGRTLPPAFRTIAALGAVMPAWFLLVTVVRDRPDIPTFGLYLTWWFVAFLIAPLLIQSTRDAKQVLAAVAAPFAAELVLFLAFQQLGATLYVPVYFGTINSLGIENPDYYAQLIQVPVIALVALTALRSFDGRQTSPGRQFMLLAIIGWAAYYFAFATHSRSSLVFLVGAGLVWLALRSRASGFFLGALAFGPLVFLLAVLAGWSNGVLNSLSSGRLGIWQKLLDGLRTDPSGPLAWLTGATRPITSPIAALAYDPLATTKAFGTVHVDNSYLEKVLVVGLIGLALFIAPYATVLARGSRAAVTPRERALFVMWTTVLLGVAAQSLTTTTIPTFNAPLGYLMAFIGVAPAVRLRS